MCTLKRKTKVLHMKILLLVATDSQTVFAGLMVNGSFLLLKSQNGSREEKNPLLFISILSLKSHCFKSHRTTYIFH